MYSVCRKIERRERDGQLQSLSVNEKDRVRAKSIALGHKRGALNERL